MYGVEIFASVRQLVFLEDLNPDTGKRVARLNPETDWIINRSLRAGASRLVDRREPELASCLPHCRGAPIRADL